MKILLVEDDFDLASNLSAALRREGLIIDRVGSGKEALDNFQLLQPELVVLDLGLPDIDGVEVLREMRKQQFQNPVLILTARDNTSDLVNALDAGADDYLSKPFEMAELLARLRVLGRRISQNQSSQISIGEMTIDLASHFALRNHQQLNLSRREYMLLKALMENAGRVLTKEALENKLYTWGEEIASNTIEVHISNLRKKLPANFIQTIRGVGYTVAKV